MINRTGSAIWEGGLKDGQGHVSTESGVLKDQPYGFGTRFGEEAGTNPEELIGAAHAACYSMALSVALEQAGIKNTRVETSSKIGLDKDADGFVVKTAHLTTRISGDGDADEILALAKQAETGCPISRLMNATITLDAQVT